MMNYKVTGIHLEHESPFSIKRKLFEDLNKIPEDIRDIRQVIETIAEACKIISGKVAIAGLTNLYGNAGGSENESGDVQKKIDVLSNSILINTLRFCDLVIIDLLIIFFYRLLLLLVRRKMELSTVTMMENT